MKSPCAQAAGRFDLSASSIACMGESGLVSCRLDYCAIADWISVLLQIGLVCCCRFERCAAAD